MLRFGGGFEASGACSSTAFARDFSPYARQGQMSYVLYKTWRMMGRFGENVRQRGRGGCVRRGGGRTV
ncbi:hypothetical protein PSP31121_02261 [Pandoraea sputorum]|uniref:Uncharacterized protein n=1 Tax=Pandoraea sputorum TaxID=93222 RepID=A0A5E5B0N1_9BURK|nr:hypothetical protein PSP31121_02261 [Pandoraea sputorum]